MQNATDPIPADELGVAPHVRPSDAAIPVDGKVDEQRLADDGVHVDEPPEAGVVRTVAVVPHHEEFPGRHPHGGHVVPAANETVDVFPVRETRILLLKRGPVDVDRLLSDLHDVPRSTDDTLDEILARVLGEDEDDDVSPFRSSEGEDPSLRVWHVVSVDE